MSKPVMPPTRPDPTKSEEFSWRRVRAWPEEDGIPVLWVVLFTFGMLVGAAEVLIAQLVFR